MTGLLASLLVLRISAAIGTGGEQPLPDRCLRGSVLGPGEKPLAAATVFVPEQIERSVQTDRDGRFEIEVAAILPVRLSVRAAGFTEREVVWNGEQPLRVTLSPVGFADTVTVTASRVPTRVRDSPASVVTLTSDRLELAPTTAIDATLRQVPGFTLFRRSDSRTANPTTQGVSLRGVGGSGASRALVLDDGVPLNDPFGGWVSWGRVIDASLDRVEVLRGGASDRYGAPGLSGVIQMVRRDPADSMLSAQASYGSAGTADAGVFASGRTESWTARLSGSAFRTGGWVLLPDDLRGPVDVPADSRNVSVDAALERFGADGRAFLRGSLFGEDRGNGTPLQVNETRLWQVAGGAEGAASGGTYAVRAYGLRESYRQTFTAVAADRSAESITRIQDVPSSAGGLSAQWEKSFGSHQLVAGVEGRLVSGASNELIGAAGASVADSGGRQGTASLFVQDVVRLAERWSLTLALRYDFWRNFDAFRARGPRDAVVPEIALPSRSADSWSPRAAFVYQASPAISLTGSVYRSFRAPTLNELYRDFRVGSALTLANGDLGPERLVGGEAGILVASSSGVFSARATLFWSEIDGAILNRTLSTTADLITRQRQNVGLTRARGGEADFEVRLGAALQVSAGYLYVESLVLASDEPALAGKRVPQVPRHQATVQVNWSPGRLRLALLGRYAAAQYEDDVNSLRLPGMVAIDGQAAFRVTGEIEIFLCAENLADRRAITGLTPLPSLGPPRLYRGGFRLRFG